MQTLARLSWLRDTMRHGGLLRKYLRAKSWKSEKEGDHGVPSCPDIGVQTYVQLRRFAVHIGEQWMVENSG